ncbi:hypothetical protein [Bacillus mycoides]|uniref:hypothetical protein n=1 Tax=Bacillus mycoides TaxID=1405 RepID=UPI002E2495B7|nr:hypothetical protein [Bacillus mycoides]
MKNDMDYLLHLGEESLALDRLSEYISNFLGFKYQIAIDDFNDEFLKIYGEHERFILPYIANLYEDLFETIEKHIYSLLGQENLIDNIHNFTESVSLEIIFNEFNISNDKDKLKLLYFISSLKELSYLTYESDPVNIGIYVCSNDKKLSLLQNSDEFEFIQVNPSDIKKLMNSEKPLLKLINNKHFNLVVNKEYEVVGILKKKTNGISLDEFQKDVQQKAEKCLYINSIINEIGLSFNDQLEGNYLEKIARFLNDEGLNKFLDDEKNIEYKNKVNSNMDKALKFIWEELKKATEIIKQSFNLNTFMQSTMFINVKGQEIDFWNNGYFPISYKKGQWKIKSFIHLAHEISVCRYLTTNDIDFFNSNSIYPNLSEVIKGIVEGNPLSVEGKQIIKGILADKINEIKGDSEYIFKLIDIAREMSKDSLGGLFVLITNEKYFSENISNIIGNREGIEIHKSFIKNGVNNPHIMDVDAGIISLIASIDGATLINKDFTINSFSEMIKSQKINTNYIGNTYGARTLAAINASLFGTSIKISEDGDITVFRDVIFRNKKRELESAPMKVLTI